MKRLVLCAVIFQLGLPTFAADAAAKAAVNYDVFSPEKDINAVLNADYKEKKGCDYYIIKNYNGSAAYASNVKVPEPVRPSDPYIFKYKGVNYIFMVSSNNPLTIQDILGINDTKEFIFSSILKLDKNLDSKITADELKQNNIRLVKISPEGKLINNVNNDFSINKIDYIDVSELKSIENSLDSGINGHFTIRLKKDNRKIVGFVISADDEIINNLF